jgi:hypothetical protein
MTSRAMRSATNVDLTPFQETVLAEYATWYTYQDTARAPILGRVIREHGEDALPKVFRSLKRSRATLQSFLREWLSLSSVRQQTLYFQTLLDIEREAVLAGRKETFMFLQEDTDYWLEQQGAFYDRAQIAPLPLTLPDIEVQSVQIARDRALVTLVEPAAMLQGPPPQVLDRFVCFRYQNGAWKHSSVLDTVTFWYIETHPALTPTPTRSP